tara:strand:+ start:591 stop:785 length:195 start_codon:yes stop_codon:yes gene_type:complete
MSTENKAVWTVVIGCHLICVATITLVFAVNIWVGAVLALYIQLPVCIKNAKKIILERKRELNND